MSGLHIIWFRQDLRVHDNAALRAASQLAARDGGEVMALYIVPAAIDISGSVANPETSFLFESVRDLQAALAQRGAVLHLRQGEAISVLSDVLRAHQVMSLHAHDTWVDDEDLSGLEAWALRAGIPFRQHRQFTPQRGAPGDSDPWQTAWERFMARPRHEAPDAIATANIGIGQWPHAPARPLENSDNPPAQRGGRKQAIQRLRTCLGAGATSAVTLSSVDAIEALKPYLQIGAVSPREVWQAAIGAHQQALKAGLDIRAASIASFLQLLPALFRPQSAKARLDRTKRASDRNAVGQQLSLRFRQSAPPNE